MYMYSDCAVWGKHRRKSVLLTTLTSPRTREYILHYILNNLTVNIGRLVCLISITNKIDCRTVVYQIIGGVLYICLSKVNVCVDNWYSLCMYLAQM